MFQYSLTNNFNYIVIDCCDNEVCRVSQYPTLPTECRAFRLNRRSRKITHIFSNHFRKHFSYHLKIREIALCRQSQTFRNRACVCTGNDPKVSKLDVD